MTKASRSAGLIWLGLLAAALLIPYGFAALTGTPAQDAAGLAGWASAAAAAYCAKGPTPLVWLQAGLLAGLAAASLAGRRLGAWAEAVAGARGGYLTGLAALAALPFLIAAVTNSSACTRGQAFFWQAIFVDVFIMAILAISYNLMFGFVGVVSFGHAAFFGLGAYSVGLLMEHLGWPWWGAVLGALAISVAIALIKGFVGLRIRGLYFALFTLAFAQVFFLLAGNRLLVNVTGAEDGFTFAVPDFLNMTKNRLFFYYLGLAAMVLAFLVVRQLMRSPTGRVLVAVRDNENRAQMLGYNTFYFKLIAIVIAGVLAGGAGVLRGLSLKGASPEVLGLDFTMTPLIMTLVGGQATFVGPVLGAFGLHLLEDFLRDTVVTVAGVSINVGERWALILGVIFILIVIVFPYGIVGTVQNEWRKRRARRP
ncbi:MAG: branched-chain amino acid ABC transporter permease [Anaerolineales bacterium]|nr:branched-chain amino acid ABC transporter permease [Anaerolineales bacterium]